MVYCPNPDIVEFENVQNGPFFINVNGVEIEVSGNFKMNQTLKAFGEDLTNNSINKDGSSG